MSDEASLTTVLPPVSWGGIDDVVVVGGGLAGLFCALKLAPRPVTLVAAAPLGHYGAAGRAQGGLAAALGPDDAPAIHAADILAAGDGLADPDIAALVARDGPRRVDDLVALAVPFDRDAAGRLALAIEPGHTRARVLRVGGDGLGAAVRAALALAVARTPSIRVLEGYVAERLVLESRFVTGLLVRPSGGLAAVPIAIPARAVVLASGGIGHLFAVTTGAAQGFGGGLAAAARAGAVVADPEFVQFHPTALALGSDPAPVASEALRSEGAVLVDRAGTPLLADPRATREVAARAVAAAIGEGRGAFLDARAAIGARFAARFPLAFAACSAAGLDPAREPIPVAPAAHHHMGGVLTDANGRSSVDGLWAAGEVAGTGAHGAGRLSSNALLEAVVFAARIAEDIQGLLPVASLQPVRPVPDQLSLAHPPGEEAAEIATLRATMTAEVGLARSGAGLVGALATIGELAARARSPVLKAMTTCALLVAVGALLRAESRGAHRRTDFPERDPALARRTFLTLAEAERIAARAAGARSAA